MTSDFGHVKQRPYTNSEILHFKKHSRLHSVITVCFVTWIKTIEEKQTLQVVLATVLYINWVKFYLIFNENRYEMNKLQINNYLT